MQVNRDYSTPADEVQPATSPHASTASNNGHHPNGYPDVLPKITIGSLHESHRAVLFEQSAISDEAIAARGYFTATDRQAMQLLGFAPAQCLVPGLMIPLYDWRCELAGYAYKADIPRRDTINGKPIKYEVPKGSTPVLDVAPLTAAGIDDPSKPLIITEGAKKADAAASRGLVAININGIYGYRGRNTKGGMTALADWENVALNGRAVYVIFDSDVSVNPSVERALQRLCTFLQSRGAIVKVIYLPAGPNEEKTGLDDFFARGHDVADLFNLARDLEPVRESRRKRKEAEQKAKIEELKGDGLPVIETNNRQLREKIKDLSAAIARYNENNPRLFRGVAGLVHLDRDATGQLRIILADAPTVQSIAAQAANWISTSEKFGVQQVNPPRDLCQNYLSYAERAGVPPVEMIMSVPFFAPDGTLCDTTGYHAAARIYLDLPADFHLPDTTPTGKNIEAAKSLLLENVLSEVAFSKDKGASRAHALALMIQPFVRKMIQGATPLYLWDAPERGSGKTYGAGLCIQPFARPCPTTEKNNKEEWRKAMFTELLEGASHIFIDNLKSSLNSAAIDAMLTASVIRERVLGGNTTATVPVQCTWVATSNNAELTQDIVTRTVVIRLDPNTPNPDLRDFSNDPEQYIWQNRAAVCGAIITLCRAWITAGRPKYKGKNKIRFREWRDVIGGILDVAKVEGFLDNAESERKRLSSEATDDWTDFVGAWWAKQGGNAATGADLVAIAKNFPAIAAMFAKEDTPAQESRKLLGALRHRRDRVFKVATPDGNKTDCYKIKAGAMQGRAATYLLEEIQTTQS